jgi:hypothetical protein
MYKVAMKMNAKKLAPSRKPTALDPAAARPAWMVGGGRRYCVAEISLNNDQALAPLRAGPHVPDAANQPGSPGMQTVLHAAVFLGASSVPLPAAE